ncbi:MAG: hypothetical protein GX627_02720 [Parcubacteria group bacterium]|nr:hypothetical protein [Parcubacteria group bacterium]
MKKQTISWLIILAFVIVGVVIFVLGSKPETPIINENGEIKGNYTLAGIMSLNQPYKCTFTKSDEISNVLGVIHVNNKNAYGEFRISTTILGSSEQFTSFLLLNNKDAYVWTSLQNIGYQSNATKSANKSSSLKDQAQIIGSHDKMDYNCSPWKDYDVSVFEIPTFIEFSRV